MSNGWPSIPLGKVARHRKQFITIDDAVEYKRCRVQLHAKGVVLRDIVSGADIKTKEQQVCRVGEFLVAEIDAKVGGFGIVPDELDGAIVSSHYFLFTIDEQQLDRRFLDYYARTPAFREQVTAQGTTNYAAIRPSHVLGYMIPLPPLPEQRRIVAKIDDLAAKVEEARGLSGRIAEELTATLIAMAHRPDLDDDAKTAMRWRQVFLGEVIREVRDAHEVIPDQRYPNCGIYSFGRGLFSKPDIDGISTSAKILNRISQGQFIYSRLFAFEGAYGMVSGEYDGCYVSNEYPTFECDNTKIRAEFLWAYFRSPQIWSMMAAESKGLGHRRQRVHPDKILSHRLWLPPMEWQDRIAHVQERVAAMKLSQTQSAAELDALLPSILDKAFKGEL